MAKVRVKFDYPIYENGINYAAGKAVPFDEEDLKRYPKKDYTIVGKKEREKKVRDISIKDKETSDIAINF